MRFYSYMDHSLKCLEPPLMEIEHAYPNYDYTAKTLINEGLRTERLLWDSLGEEFHRFLSHYDGDPCRG